MNLTPTRFLSFSFASTKHVPKTLFSPRPARIKQNNSRSSIISLKIPLPTQERRSANYHPTVWTTDLIDSLTTPYLYDTHADQLEELKQEAKTLLSSNDGEDPSQKLELIDSIQRLGLAYHFEEEIREAVTLIQLDPTTTNLYITSLHFRLLRENGFPISTEVFDKFRDDGKFMEALSEDWEGLLSLFEASHLGVIGELVLDEAREFSSRHLLGNESEKRSQEVPLRWRMPRLEARNFIDVYRESDKRSSVLFELARLDYNAVLSIHQSELKELSRWWKELGFKKRLGFSRDRLVENYLWALGLTFEPEFSKCRVQLTKFICILSATDDMYDVYGTPDELELFTDAINRWDIRAVDDIPEYMRPCYSAILDFVNEMKDSGLPHTLPYLVEEWQNLCRAYMVEARWFRDDHTPSFDEYMDNAWTSIGGPAAIVHASVLSPGVTEQTLDSFKLGRELVRCASLITRLCNDLGTSQAEIERGDVAKSVKCYMMKTGATEEQTMDHMRGLISDLWKRLNGEILYDRSNSLPKPFVNMTLNMARSAHCIYQHGDGIGTSTGVTKDRLISLISKEIP